MEVRKHYGSLTSANRTVSGSSAGVGGTVWRIPSQHRYSTGKTPPAINTASPGSRSHSRNAFASLVRNLRLRFKVTMVHRFVQLQQSKREQCGKNHPG